MRTRWTARLVTLVAFVAASVVATSSPRAEGAAGDPGTGGAIVGAGAGGAGEREEEDVRRTVVRGGAAAMRGEPPTGTIAGDALEGPLLELPRVLDDAPGVRVTRLGGLTSHARLSIRGTSADQALIFLDGLPLVSADGGPVDLSTIPLGPVSAVDVYRGFAPLGFQASAIGGAIDVKTRQLSGTRVSVEAGGGSQSSRLARAFVGHGDRTWRVGVGVDYLGTAGDFSYPHDGGTAFDPSDDRTVTRRNNAADQLSVLTTARARLGDGLRVTLLEQFFWRSRGLPGLGLFETQDSRLDELRNLVGARLDARTASVEASATAYLLWARTVISDPLGEIGLGRGERVGESVVPGMFASVGFPVRLSSGRGVRLTPIIGAAWRWEGFDADDGDAASTRPAAGRHLLAATASLRAEVAQTDSVLTATLRYEHAASTLRDEGRASGAGGPSWRVALANHAVPDVTVQMAAGRALRLPSLFERFGDTGYVLGNPDLRPEAGTSVEAGIVWTAADLEAGWLRLEARGFGTWVDDLIQFVQNSQQVSRPENVDRARILGAELAASADLFQWLRVRGSLTALEAINTSRLAARRGNRLPLRPRWQGFARVEGYQRFGAFDAALHADVSILAGNTVDHANLVRLPARVVVGAGADVGAIGGRLRFGLRVDNLGDARVVDVLGFPLPGTTWTATVRWIPLQEAGR